LRWPGGTPPLGSCAFPALFDHVRGESTRCRTWGSTLVPPTVAPLSPFRRDWHGRAAVKLAQAIYEDRLLPSGHLDAARLPLLADMLDEAGATDAELLGHLRSAGPRVRGYVGIDAVLGKE